MRKGITIAVSTILVLLSNPSSLLAAEFLLTKNQTVVVSGEITGLKPNEMVVDSGMTFYTVDIGEVMQGYDATTLLETGMRVSVRGKLADFPDTRYVIADDVITLGPDMNEETAAALLQSQIEPATGE